MAQILSLWSKGLFQHAIEMSGAALLLKEPYPNGTISLETAEKRGTGFAETVGYGDTQEVADCLRQLSMAQVLEHRKEFRIGMTVIDGDFMPRRRPP